MQPEPGAVLGKPAKVSWSLGWSSPMDGPSIRVQQSSNRSGLVEVALSKRLLLFLKITGWAFI